MTNLKFAVVLDVISAIALVSSARAVGDALKDKYHAVQVDRFDIQPGVKFPVDYLVTLQEEILKQLQNSKEFQDVLRPGENPARSDAQVLRLSGTINHFKPGSRAKRYVVGFGAGSTEIYAHVAFLDRSTGETVMTEEVKAAMAGGFIGGESLNVTRGFAKQVVNTTKLVLLKRLPAAGTPSPPSAGGTLSAAAGAPPTLDRHVVTVSSSDFPGAQQKLDVESAAGYRVTGLALTGKKKADVTLEKSATPPDVYHYLLFHGGKGSLQKDLNKAADDGFRLCPHTLAQVGGHLALIVEKPPVVPKTRYQYRVHITVRVSSAERDTEKDQSQGYTLAEETDLLYAGHVVVLEKPVEKGSEDRVK